MLLVIVLELVFGTPAADLSLPPDHVLPEVSGMKMLPEAADLQKSGDPRQLPPES